MIDYGRIVIVVILLLGDGGTGLYQKGQFEYVRGCYFTNWAQYRQDRGKYTPEHYIPGLCTHVFYAFVTMDNDFQLKPFEWNDDSTEGTVGNYERVNRLKHIQPDLKTLLSFGGYTFSQANAGLLSKMAATNETRRTFITSIMKFTRERNFDGFDFDWEYPLAEDKQNFATLIKETRESFEQEAHESGKARLLLTAAVAAGTDKIDTGYDAPMLAKALDYVNVMTYDFHGSWEAMTGFNSPLYDRNNDSMSVNSAAAHWVSIGIPRKKLLIGFGTYGRGWILANGQFENGVGASTINPSPAQNYTKETGVAAYYEICHLLTDSKVTRTYDTQQQAPYLLKDNVWFGYDDEQSFDEKLQWLKQNGFGGAFVWTLDQDDFIGQCPNGNNIRYPLISRIATRLGKQMPMDVLKSNTTLAPPRPKQRQWSTSSWFSPSSLQQSNFTSTNSTSADYQCTALGLFPDPTNCQTYFSCGKIGAVGLKMSCGAGTMFNPDRKFCDWPSNVKCLSL